MRDKQKGGPAFPVMMGANESGLIEYHHQGMTLRDYFAAKAMQTLNPNQDPKINAARAYEVADAMLKARAE